MFRVVCIFLISWRILLCTTISIGCMLVPRAMKEIHLNFHPQNTYLWLNGSKRTLVSSTQRIIWIYYHLLCFVHSEVKMIVPTPFCFRWPHLFLKHRWIHGEIMGEFCDVSCPEKQTNKKIVIISFSWSEIIDFKFLGDRFKSLIQLTTCYSLLPEGPRWMFASG